MGRNTNAAEEFRRNIVIGIVGGVLLTAAVAIYTLGKGATQLLTDELAGRAMSDTRALAVSLSAALQRGHARTAERLVKSAAELPDLQQIEVADAEGRILVASDAASVGTTAGQYHRVAAESRSQGHYSAGDELAGNASLLLVWPVLGETDEETGETPLLATLAMRYSTARMDQALFRQMLISSFLVLIFTGISGGIAYFFLLRQGLRPIARILRALERMGAGDLSARVDPEGMGAFEALGEALNTMWGNFGSLAGRVVDITGRLHAVTERLGAAMHEIEEGSESQVESAEDTASLLAKVNSSIRTVNSEIETLSRSTEEASSSTLELSSSVDEVARSVGSLNDAVESASSSSQEMGASIRQVAESADEVQRMAEETAASMTQMDRAIQEVGDHVRQASELTERVSQGAEEGSEAVASTIDGIEEIRTLTDDARQVLEQLVQRIGEIGEILTVIGEINDETNLLSLNAAIIAAQAGEQGKAFAVVATHVKTLARRTAMSTQEIERLISSVQEESRNAMKAMAAGINAVENGVDRSQKAGDALSRIRSLAAEANARVSEITRAAHEQGRNSNHVAEAANRTSAMVQKISNAMSEQSRASEQMLHTSETALGVCRQVARSTEEQRETSSFISEGISSIGEMMRAIHQNMGTQQGASEAVVEALERVLEVARKTGGRVPEIVTIFGQLQRDAHALETEISRFRHGDQDRFAVEDAQLVEDESDAASATQRPA